MNVEVDEQSKILVVGDDEEVALSELPAIHDINQLCEYADAVAEQYPDERGAKTFVGAVDAYVKHLNFAEVHRKRIVSSHKSMNGIRTPRGPQGQTMRGKRSLAARYYNTLSAEDVRDYCTRLNIDHDSYETIDDRFTAMAQARHPDSN